MLPVFHSSTPHRIAPQILEKLNSHIHSDSTIQQFIEALAQVYGAYDYDPDEIMEYSMEIWSPLEGVVGHRIKCFYDGKNLFAAQDMRLSRVSPKTNNLPISQFLSPVSQQIQLCLPPSRCEGPRVKVKVITLAGKTITVKLHRNETVEELKECVQHAAGYPPDQQRIILDGKQLQDDCTLSDYNIGNGTILHLVLRLRGGMMHETSGRTDYDRTAASWIPEFMTAYYKSDSGKIKALEFPLSSNTSADTLTQKIQMETDIEFFNKMSDEQIKAIPKSTRDILSHKALARLMDSLLSRS